MQVNKCFFCMEDMSPEEERCPHCGKRRGEISQPEYALRLGTILHGKYLIGAVLGQGGFGITYLGYDLFLGIKVAIKEYYPSNMVNRSRFGTVLWNAGGIPKEEGCSSFLKEARKMAKLMAIPEVVRVLEILQENDTAYIVMDFVEGITLKERLKRGGLMSAEEIITLLGPIADALDQVHKHGMIHRDVSPDNIMLDRDGKAKLLDLGAAKEMDMRSDRDKQSSQLIHRDGFSPPEQYIEGGTIGPWTDVYAMSATVYYGMTGRVVPQVIDRLYNGKTVGFALSFPQSVRTVLEKGLAVQTQDRYQTMGEFWNDLQKAAFESDHTDSGGDLGSDSKGFGGTSGSDSKGFGGTSGSDSKGFGETSGQNSKGFGETSGQNSKGFGETSGSDSKGFGGTSGSDSKGFGNNFGQNSGGSGGNSGSDTKDSGRNSGENPPKSSVSKWLFLFAVIAAAALAAGGTVFIMSRKTGDTTVIPETAAAASETTITVPETTAVELETITAESETITAEPETITAESETTTAESETTTAESETTTAESETITAESETTTAESETITAESEITVGSETITAVSETTTAASRETTAAPETTTAASTASTAASETTTAASEKTEPETTARVEASGIDFDNLSVGDRVKFGSYEQDNDTSNGSEKLEWLVQYIDEKEGKVLLVSRFGLDVKPYNEERKEVTWETSTLRKWLNGEFLSEAFTEAEKSMIQATAVNGGSGSGDTTDMVFLLSSTEAETYLGNEPKRRCGATEYAKAQGASNSGSGRSNYYWWLRDYDGISAAYVKDDGSFDLDGYFVDYVYIVVRPALWLKPE